MMDIASLIEYVDNLPTEEKKLDQADRFIELAAAIYMTADLSEGVFHDFCRKAWEMLDRALTEVIDECSSVN